MKLFRILEDKQIEIVEEKSYRNKDFGGFGEVTLQELLCDYPEVIPGEEIDKKNPPRFLVIRREAGVTAGSIDLLLIDNEGIPTVIETKLIDNREIRRSVLAQGLEYLSHLKSEWNAERIIDEGRSFWKTKGIELDNEFQNRLGVSLNEDFIQKLDSNLNTNRMRLLIVGDEIPSELTRIIEFLNDASEFDVFGVEIRLFASPDKKYKMLIPHLIGYTETTKEKKEKRTSINRWDKERFFDVLTSTKQETVPLAENILEFGKQLTGKEVEWGVGKERGSYTAKLVLGKEKLSLFSVYTTGHFSINIGWNSWRFSSVAPKLSETYRNRVLKELDIDFSQKAWEKGWPEAKLDLIQTKIDVFKNIITDFVDEVRSNNYVPIA